MDTGNQSARDQFPKRVRQVRKALGMTQPQAAEKFGISLPTLRAWERGSRTPAEGHCARMLAELDQHLEQRAAELRSQVERLRPPESELSALRDLLAGMGRELRSVVAALPADLQPLAVDLVRSHFRELRF